MIYIQQLSAVDIMIVASRPFLVRLLYQNFHSVDCDHELNVETENGHEPNIPQQRIQ
jgi:hypothetical protein